LGNGEKWGIEISYAMQASPDGLPQAFSIGESFIDNGPSALILGDNIFHGHSFENILCTVNAQSEGATIFAYHVNNPSRYGVFEFDHKNQVIDFEEKPEKPKSNFAMTGLYFYDSNVVEYAKSLRPSSRGELEITDLNRIYLEQQKLSVERLGRGYAWLDAGTHSSLLEASQFIHSVEKRQGLKIGCPEEVAYRMGFITEDHLNNIIETCPQAEYAVYLKNVLLLDND